VILGDTVFDIEMGRNAGIQAIGVSWGYHPVEDLKAAGAERVLGEFGQLAEALNEIWGTA
jgi:phosphoglycolate phosphatase